MISLVQMLITLLIICCLFSGLQSRGQYTIVAPGTMRSNSEYQVSVSLDHFTQPCRFNISLETSKSTFDLSTFKVDSGTTQLIKIQSPKLYSGYGVLVVKSWLGLVTYERCPINIEERHYMLYIQTDRGKYKPGEVVQFRLIFIDRVTRPAKIDDTIDVYIYDGQRNVIRMFSDVKLKQGVFRGDLQLSGHPVLGDWTIEVRVGGATIEENIFQVERYILPKFAVEINTKKSIALEDKNITINVESRYTYDQPVHGNLTLNLAPTYGTYPFPTANFSYEFDGESAISLDLDKDLDIGEHSFLSNYIPPEYCSYTVVATVTEALTGEYHSATTEVKIYFQPYKIRVEAPKIFYLEDFVNITVLVTNLQDIPIQDTKSPIQVTLESSKKDTTKMLNMSMDEINQFYFGDPVRVESTIYLNEVGMGMTTMKIPSDELILEYKAAAKYLKYVSRPTELKKITNNLKLDVLTKRPEVGKELLIRLSSEDHIEYFIYEIVSRGVILTSERINVSSSQGTGQTTSYLLSIDLTYDMVPKITLYVHRIKNRFFHSKLKEIYIKRAFHNSINITTENEVLPGSQVSINVTTDEGSYVGLMGIDASLLLDPDYKTSLTEDNVYTKLNNYDFMIMDDRLFPGSEAGLITFSNGLTRGGQEIGRPSIVAAEPGEIFPKPNAFDKPSIELPRIRKLFSESWIFKDFERSPVDGFKVTEVIPDTITSWAITGFSLNSNTGLALSKNVTKLKVFQEFFISMDLPSSVKEGEIIEIPVFVFNYMKQSLLADVTIYNPTGNLEFLNNLSSEPSIQTNQTFSKSIPVNGKEKFVFLLRPRKSGLYNVTVKAISNVASDAVQKTLTVEADGVPYMISKTYLVHLLENSDQREDEILVQIPEKFVPDSESVDLTVTSDIFRPLIRNLEKLIRVPFGSSENNMKYFVSNLLVLKYLKTLNQSNLSLKSRAKLHLELGYQTQLTFKHLDGSFSLFDRTVERTGDIWITSYTLWALQQAKDFIHVDSNVIERGLAYLKRKQSENGGFNSGKGVEEDVVLTAFITLTFLVENTSQSRYQGVITKSLIYLYDALDDLEQPTSTAITTYALMLGKHEKSRELLVKLSPHAALQSKQLQWTRPDTLQSILETTSYSFMSLLESQEVSFQNLFLILQSLTSVEQGKRTPAHMLALEAMIKFARYIDFNANDLSIYYEIDQGECGDLRVNPDNAQTLQQVELKKTTRCIKLRTKGRGFALVSVNYKYNMVPENQSSNYQTNVTVKELTDRTLVFDVCVAMRSSDSRSNLTIMEVHFQSGYVVYDGSFDSIKKSNELVKSVELIGGHQSVRVYFRDVSRNGTCIKLVGIKRNAVFNLKAASVVVYDPEREDQRLVLYHEMDPGQKEDLLS